MCKKFMYLGILALLLGLAGSAPAADAEIAETSSAPTIDGSVDSVWSNANSYSIANVIVGTVTDDSDLSGTWRALWDSSNLYYLVEITDDALNNDSTDAWDDDSIEIFIDADNSKATSYDGVNDYQYVFRWNDGAIHLGSNSATNTTGISFTIADTANGYTLEVSIPWTTLGVTAAQGNLIGTDVQANDDDDGGGRDGKKAWYATDDNCWQNPSLFATAELVSGAVPPPGQASNLSPADGATDVDINADLSWVAGSGATSHDVYFGDVTSPPFVGNQTATTYDPGTLSEVTSYYWRIDEVGDGGTTEGVVWSFTTATVSEWTQLTYDDFEAGWGSYTDGGKDCSRYTGGTYAHQGSCAADIQDNSGDISSFYYTNGVDVDTPGYTQIKVDFWFYPKSMDRTGEDFWLLYYDGATWHTVKTWDKGIDFENDDFYHDTVYIDESSYTFPTDMKLKFQCDASGNYDDIYIDEIEVSAIGGGAPQPPGQASNPSPADGATDQSIDVDLSWSAGSGATSHDVYFGTDSTPDSGEFQGNQTAATFDAGTLENDTTYYWCIDEKNTGGTTTGTVWSFTTLVAPPDQASNPSPADSATNQSVDVDLTWTAGFDATSHDVYFGTDSTPDSGEFQGNQTAATFDPGTLANNTIYYWRIDEKNAGGTTTGTTWSFTTEAATPPPGQASNPSPADGATDVTVSADLTWTAGSDTTSHDVYFGTPGSPPFVQNQAATTYDPGTLANDTTYYWQIDEVGAGGTTTGSTWSFTTTAGGGQTTLNPTADASSQSGGCEAASLSFSLWNHILMKFDLASVPTPVTSAILRLYYESSQTLTIYVHDASSDTWDECGTLPTKGSTQMASASATGPGWYEFTVTSYVDAQAAGDNVITFCISNSHDNWWSLCAREGPNPPQLVVQYGGGGPPGQATNPNPANGETGVSTTATLSWTPGAGATSHDVYFGTPASPPFIQNQAVTTYNPGTLANGTIYYWRIDEINAQGTTTGAVWNFTTAAAVPPGQASNPNPATGATGVSTSVALSWTAGSGATSHDVYFGTDSTPDSGEFMGNQTGTTYDPGALAATTTYYWRIDEKNAYGTTTGPVWNFTTGSGAPAGMTVGCNFWRIEWGEGGWSHYFASGVDWSTTSNPWNPTFVSELQESKMTCLRFMDWVITNGSAVTSWSQRIPKTANHYYSGNTVPLLNSDGSSAGNGYGVAYEWQIDLCNRVGADIWVTVPHAANADYQTQLANLLYNNLNSNLKIYVEYSNECWNWGFYQTKYCDEQSTAVGIRDLDVGEYCEPWWKYKIYASVRLFEQFENVFGVDSPRLVKVIGCQVGYNWGGYDYNHQIIGELACLNNSTINPNGVTVDAWAAAPYWGTSVGNIADMMLWAHNSLVGTGIKLLCYEGGSDNYSDPEGCTTVQLDPAQEQLYIDALNAIEPYCEGVFNQYCFVGDCWGLKKSTGDPASEAPKWRGAMQWINSHY